MLSRRRLASILVIGCLGFGAMRSLAEQAPVTPATDKLPLFAVKIRTGPKWDATRNPQEQPFFREHSANLKRLRDAGQLIVGARYSDVGLVIIAAESEAQVRSLMDEDPSVGAGVFRYDVHPFNVFYPGTVYARPRPAAGD